MPTRVTNSVGSDRVFIDPEARIRHSGGQAIAELVQRRQGVIQRLPDAVVIPADRGEVEAVVGACDREGVAVVPFGGGTSVVGGVHPERGSHNAVIALDTAGLRGFSLDLVSGTASLGAGLRGAETEALLNRNGLTLGHFPQSFEYATIGGFAATRSAGQASGGYGRFDDMVTSVELISPVGSIKTPKTPHSSAGPSIRQLILGSEGALGVIPRVEVAVTELPEVRAWEAWLVPEFGTGCDLARRWAQEKAGLAVVRISDLEETRITLDMGNRSGLTARAWSGYLGLKGVRPGSLVILGIEGDRDRVRALRRSVRSDLRSAGGVSLGQAAGRAWASGRFDAPYLREGLIDLGLVVETLESAASWSRYEAVYRDIKELIEDTLNRSGAPSVVMCHLSHAYIDGASFYFTIVADPSGRDPGELWREVKSGALTRITDLGLTVSHHHATGRDHAPFLPVEVGDAGTEALKALKQALDPRGIMNPGCLLAD